MKIISLGWGVQSFTIAAMVALGELEPVDVAIHADTTHEASWTYDFARRWTPWLEEHGVKVVTVKPSDAGVVDRFGGVMIPAYIENGGTFSRQCTDKWKRANIRRWLQTNRNDKQVDQWIGISLDEYQRMRESDVKYITNRYPLIDKRMTRNDCANWLARHGLELPKRSACTFCPFHSSAEWRMIKASPVDRAEALEVDKNIRQARLPGGLFVHPARVPLDQVDFRTAEERGQLSLWDNECSGICGV